VRTRVFLEELKFVAAEPGESVDPGAQRAAIDDYFERLHRASSLVTFVQANGQEVRRWLSPWRDLPTAARVLVPPPPWSVQ
jgi:hypothetical protein